MSKKEESEMPQSSISAESQKSNEFKDDGGSAALILMVLALVIFVLVLLYNLPGLAEAGTLSSGQQTGDAGLVKANNNAVVIKERKIDWKPPVAPVVVQPQIIDEKQAKMLEERWGVRLISLNLSAGGYMMDFRFRVLDAEKSILLFDHRIKPHIITDRTNIKLPVPMAAKVGAFRPTNRGKNIKPDRNYYIMFGNPDRHVKSGETVAIVIGDFRVDGVSVN
ncbi:MAG: hypothetical protein OI74_15350 [Gammaproteobacteria bacterium (ex Lamellibrachia satsuma)]|nr:MAG: hypothetical protein HPY30_15340 [Gammaproteobacteria bacterium (ex Lamellibrachia satsuma)]RRS31157.1 MAG: hypothetical protein OI74_15350 [Gammaproteobacteria bacterium (ex Lamellibrachia satsuma)]RRS35479.1 MAG: hypothetical protein NV67_10440 [Gammaproteobacteria bacterium (ex Lamellibrachia satsuma)]RRS37079.1 MAG: hypothetical protein NV67_03540 [Gammaproteobacteria bacterium (ex Lamellibrachia satsuma)]